MISSFEASLNKYTNFCVIYQQTDNVNSPQFHMYWETNKYLGQLLHSETSDN